MSNTKNEKILIRCDSKLKADATAAATAENRSLTNFIETLLRQRLYGTPGETLPPQAKEAETPLSSMKHKF